MKEGRCYMCGTELPPSRIRFCSNSCNREARKLVFTPGIKRKIKKVKAYPDKKKCSACRKYLDYVFFNKNSWTMSGYDYSCRKCQKHAKNTRKVTNGNGK